MRVLLFTKVKSPTLLSILKILLLYFINLNMVSRFPSMYSLFLNVGYLPGLKHELTTHVPQKGSPQDAAPSGVWAVLGMSAIYSFCLHHHSASFTSITCHIPCGWLLLPSKHVIIEMCNFTNRYISVPSIQLSNNLALFSKWSGQYWAESPLKSVPPLAASPSDVNGGGVDNIMREARRSSDFYNDIGGWVGGIKQSEKPSGAACCWLCVRSSWRASHKLQ